MNEAIFARIRHLFDVPEMQNNLRGLWVEAMVCELLRDDWRHTGRDWSPWDLERWDGLKIEVKQSAQLQSWGKSKGLPRFDITPAKGQHLENGRFLPNSSGARFADIYIFAWHDGQDQRSIDEWQFHVVTAKLLPSNQKSLGLSGIRALANPVGAMDLRHHVDRTARKISTRHD